MKKPTIGRIVHYNTEVGILSAIICWIHSDDFVNLTVFLPDGNIMAMSNVKFGNNLKEWSWPIII